MGGPVEREYALAEVSRIFPIKRVLKYSPNGLENAEQTGANEEEGKEGSPNFFLTIWWNQQNNYIFKCLSHVFGTNELWGREMTQSGIRDADDGQGGKSRAPMFLLPQRRGGREGEGGMHSRCKVWDFWQGSW